LLAGPVAGSLKVLEYRHWPAVRIQAEGQSMSLLIVYIALMIVGDLFAYVIGLAVERTMPGASLPIFLAMYFLFLGVAWLVAVRITKPREQAAAGTP
jgi:hypothetical protein